MCFEEINGAALCGCVVYEYRMDMTRDDARGCVRLEGLWSE